MTLAEAKKLMAAKAAELAALVRSRHLTYVGAENSIAAYAEGLSPGTDYTEAWKLYDHGIEQFRRFHASASGVALHRTEET